MKSTDIWDIIGFLSGVLLLFSFINGYVNGYWYFYPVTYTCIFIISAIVYIISYKKIKQKNKNTYE